VSVGRRWKVWKTKPTFCRQEVEGLEDEADLLGAEFRPPILGHLEDVLTVEENSTGARLVESGEQSEQRRLATAGRADDGYERLRLDFEVQVGQHG